ncbi:MAG: phosphoribosyl-ATP diphosphatase [Planctomycetota bacterium]|nr:MAG: phosphoribosyl-ATP diphosphatase [Planctomycetota bacterium]
MHSVGETLENLERTIVSRKGDPIDRSYTARLFHAGAHKIGGKLTEEAGELAMAGVADADDRVVAECADLLYHALVLLAHRGVPLASVTAELERRCGRSGLEEKASRAGHEGDQS